MKAQRETATDAYVYNHARANELLDIIRGLVQELPAPDCGTRIHWGHVGDLREINHRLQTVVEFLTGEEAQG